MRVLFAALLVAACSSVHAEAVNDHTTPAGLTVGTGNSAFYLESLALGIEGGNLLRFEARDNFPPSPFDPSVMRVDVNGTLIELFLSYAYGNDSSGIPKSVTTAAQAVAAINANQAAHSLLTARLLGDGTGIVQPFPRFFLSDSLYVAPVPLPAAAWLLLSGLGGLGAVARRRRDRVQNTK